VLGGDWRNVKEDENGSYPGVFLGMKASYAYIVGM
jgi:hypothetical protein